VASTHDNAYASTVIPTVLSTTAHSARVIAIHPIDCPTQYA
jgi:hypothetical protein